MPSLDRRSRLGVRRFLAPRKPMRSARVESRVISTRLGLTAAAETLMRGRKVRTREIRRRPATTFRVMTVSVKYNLFTCSPDLQTRGDVVNLDVLIARQQD